MLPRIGKVILVFVAINLMTMSGTADVSRLSIKPTLNTTFMFDLHAPVAANEPNYQGKPLSYWLMAIRNRDAKLMPTAFDAIRALGPGAQAAVPELTRVISAPFAPIEVEKDSDDLIYDKIDDIQTRAEAMDALGAIGAAAAPAAMPIIMWALAERFTPPETGGEDNDARFMALIGLDYEQRLQAVVVVSQLGEGTIPTVAALLRSSDPEKRKFAVAVLGEDALPVVSALLKSSSCKDKQLGIDILTDLAPMVGETYVEALKSRVVCDADLMPAPLR